METTGLARLTRLCGAWRQHRSDDERRWLMSEMPDGWSVDVDGEKVVVNFPARRGLVAAEAGRFRSKDAFARYNGTAPLPVWSANKQRHRLSRIGNRESPT